MECPTGNHTKPTADAGVTRPRQRTAAAALPCPWRPVEGTRGEGKDNRVRGRPTRLAAAGGSGGRLLSCQVGSQQPPFGNNRSAVHGQQAPASREGAAGDVGPLAGAGTLSHSAWPARRARSVVSCSAARWSQPASACWYSCSGVRSRPVRGAPAPAGVDDLEQHPAS